MASSSFDVAQDDPELAEGSSSGQKDEEVVRKASLQQEQTMTTAEYLRTPESLMPTELIYGTLRVAESPLPRHQAVVLDLAMALTPHVQERRLGQIWISPLDVILDAERALIIQPDLFFISNERSYILLDRVRGAPDLIVEVLSPHPRIGKLGERIGWFQEYGVKECWLIHQLEYRVEVLNFVGTNVIERASFDNRTPIRSRVLPEFDRTLGSMLRWQ
jgi:Uma2 family endonuclease